MGKLALVMLAVGGLLSACVAYEVPGPGGRYYGDRYRDGTQDRVYRDRDRYGDGVQDRQYRRSDDSRRY